MHALELTRGNAALTTGYQLISLRDEDKFTNVDLP